MSESPRRANKQAQLWCVVVMSVCAVLAMAFANQADGFGKATMLGPAMVCGVIAGVALIALLVLRTSLWLDD